MHSMSAASDSVRNSGLVPPGHDCQSLVTKGSRKLALRSGRLRYNVVSPQCSVFVLMCKSTVELRRPRMFGGFALRQTLQSCRKNHFELGGRRSMSFRLKCFYALRRPRPLTQLSIPSYQCCLLYVNQMLTRHPVAIVAKLRWAGAGLALPSLKGFMRHKCILMLPI